MVLIIRPGIRPSRRINTVEAIAPIIEEVAPSIVRGEGIILTNSNLPLPTPPTDNKLNIKKKRIRNNIKIIF